MVINDKNRQEHAVRVATQYASAPCRLTISSYLFARWHLFRHVGYLKHQQQVDLWPFDLENGVRVTCDVGYLCANFSLPRPLCSRVTSDVRDRRQTDRRQTDVRQKHRLMPPPYGSGGIIRWEMKRITVPMAWWMMTGTVRSHRSCMCFRLSCEKMTMRWKLLVASTVKTLLKSSAKRRWKWSGFITARRYAWARYLLSACVCPSVCLLHSCVVLKRLKISSNVSSA